MGRASSRQSDHQSDGGYRSDGLGGGRCSGGSGSRMGADGYRSEGSTDSPQRKHQVEEGVSHSKLMNSKGMNGVFLQSFPAAGNNTLAGNGGHITHTRPPGPHYHPHSHVSTQSHSYQKSKSTLPQVPPHLGLNTHHKQPQRSGQLELQAFGCPPPCSTSRSMHSFQRQESSTSFQVTNRPEFLKDYAMCDTLSWSCQQSGHSMQSTHSAPLCPNHGPASQHPPPSHPKAIYHSHNRHQVAELHSFPHQLL